MLSPSAHCIVIKGIEAGFDWIEKLLLYIKNERNHLKAHHLVGFFNFCS